eukprot:scaffold38131_cov155-Skeletonema_dohrnii-CCMP3373.AAC.1
MAMVLVPTHALLWTLSLNPLESAKYGHPNNLFSSAKPTCSESGGGTSAWLRYGQCKTTGGTDPYTVKTAINTGCPGQHDSSIDYESGDTVEDNQV